MRYRRLLVTPALFLRHLQAGTHRLGYSVLKDAVPADTRVVNVRLGWPHTIELLLESSEFSPVAEGEEIVT